MSIFEKYQQRYDQHQAVTMTLGEYLNACKEDPSMYAVAGERMLKAIGEPEIVDTRKDDRLSRIFSNRKVRRYPAFNDFYGMEDTIERIVAFYRHAAQGVEESKQVLYLLGPVGGGKSSLAERLKKLMEKEPYYALRAYNYSRQRWETAPTYESPLVLFDQDEDAQEVYDNYGIPSRYLKPIPSAWVDKRLQEVQGDISQFHVVKVWPSVTGQVGITKVEPGDENNQDISGLVGKVNIRELEDYDQHDPDAYAWNGGLNIATQGMMEFVEMFKAPLKMLNPLLTATQEGHYNGTEQFGAIPFQGLILAHSNESEWKSFKANKNNEAFLDRIYIVKVPYCLRVTEEGQIYNKLISGSELANAPIAPGTLDMMAQFSVLSRLVEPENSNLYSKMRVYDGQNLKDKDPSALSIEEYRKQAGPNEGMDGMSTRFAFKILSKVFNYDSNEIAANPIHLMHVLEATIDNEDLDAEETERLKSFIKGILAPNYASFIGDELQKAYLESYHEYGQNLFDRYIEYADAWLQENDFRDPDTGEMMDKESLDDWLKEIEKAAGVHNVKDHRSEVVGFVHRYRANNQGHSPDWTEYEKLREVIEAKMFANTEELIPVISFSKKSSEEEEQKHNEFVRRMMDKGYTRKQVQLAVEWYMRYRKHN